MRYFANPTSQAVRDAMSSGQLGCITTPAQGNRVPEGAYWCADNGCFSDAYPGDAKWWAWLQTRPWPLALCAFAVAPDVVGNAAATLERSAPWLPLIRSLGYPAAFVAQDGLENLPVPWDEFDVLFIGGTTDWKLGTAARSLVGEAKARGKSVHCGRVNSYRRLSYMHHIGVDSADGTVLARGGDTNLHRPLWWLHKVHTQPELFGGMA